MTREEGIQELINCLPKDPKDNKAIGVSAEAIRAALELTDNVDSKPHL